MTGPARATDADGETVSLDGRVVVVTGASSGIGEAAARSLARAGAEVAVVGRSPERTEAVAKGCGATPFVCDFSRLEEVRQLAASLAARYTAIDVLANNAGLFSRRRVTTTDGFELTEQVNHLAPFLLTNLLDDRLGPGSRVVTTSSRVHLYGRLGPDGAAPAGPYGGWRAYSRSKLENVLFSNELARRLAARGATSVAFHPGSVRTGFGRRGGAVSLVYGTPIGRLVLVSPRSGADTLVWLASAPVGSGWEPGGYYFRRRPARARESARDPALAARLWERSARDVGLS
ncbi:MAG: SDR family NAD(P)-dependent oxidoreductase [Actinomycetota bacterium]|nr:SDR family NAD(P)-dependent oxidoreductase [Actinomycetota bacterium]